MAHTLSFLKNCLLCIRVCVHVSECLSACEGQKVLDALELALRVALCCRVGCWEPNTDPLEEQQLLLAAKPSLQAFLSWRGAEDQTHSLALAKQMF